ncbi:MAG: phosphatidate cytidylyltransferase [Planctomycetota bacterium]
MLRQRVPSAIVMTLGLLGVMWLDHALAARFRLPGLVLLLGLLVPAAWLASREIGVLMHAVGIGAGPRGRVIFVGAVAGLAIGLWKLIVGWLKVMVPQMGGLYWNDFTLALLIPGLAAVLLGWLVLHLLRRERSAAGAIHLLSALAVGFVFVGLLMSSWLWVRVFLEPWGLAAAVMVIKSCDIGAYFTGRFAGRHKLIVWLSPGKTWEGLAGGLVVAAAVCLVVEPLLTPAESAAWPWWYCLMAGALLGYVGQLGDLFASALKRDAGVKDFARTIPGFGGVMDVIDSLLLAGPVVLGLVWLGGWFG